VHFEKILSVKTDKELGLGLLEMKGWGMGLSNIWFACNLSRRFDGLLNVVVHVQGDSIRKGFSIERAEALHVLDKVLSGPRQTPQ